MNVTPRHIQILRFISYSIEVQGWPPTVRELMSELQVTSNNAIQDQLRTMQEKGLIERERGMSRGIRITPAGRAVLKEEAGEK